MRGWLNWGPSPSYTHTMNSPHQWVGEGLYYVLREKQWRTRFNRNMLHKDLISFLKSKTLVAKI